MSQQSKKERLVSASLLVASLIACGSPDRSGKANRPSSTSLCVVGIDWSGSYSLQEQAKEEVAVLVGSLKPGDELYLFSITDRSYLNNSLFLHVVFPASTVTLSDSTNPFDVRRRLLKASQEQNLEQTRSEVRRRISEWQLPRSDHTDILGFIAFASEILGGSEGPVEKRLYLATDLNENVHFRPRVDLRGVEVIVFAMQHDSDPRRVQERRAVWESFFKTVRARSVSFYSAGCPAGKER